MAELQIADLFELPPRVREVLGRSLQVVYGGGEAGGSDYSGSDSFQPVAADFTLADTAGSTDGTDTSHLAAIMGNILGDTLAGARDANYLGGVIGAFSITGNIPTTYPAGAVLAEITDGVDDQNDVYGVVAYIDGDSATTRARAAFGVMSNNSTAASGFAFGLDLYHAAHDGYAAVDQDFYTTADIRLAAQAVIKSGTGSPDTVVTAPKGSLFVRIDGTSAAEVLYVNTDGATAWTGLS